MEQDHFYRLKESNAFFDRWKKDYKENNQIILRDHKKTILKTLKNNINLRSLKVLEIGSFISDLLYFLKKDYNCKISGVEPSSKAVKFALKKYKIKINNKTFYNSEFFGFKKKLKKKFDLIICDDVLSWIDREIILETLSSLNWILKDNGYIFLRDFCPKNSFSHINHHWPNKKIYNFKVSDGHKSFFLNSGKYKTIFNKAYYTKKFQKIKIYNKESYRWSDTILQKTTKHQHKLIKF
ncbi:class I SAM-dependent methyltransferase [Candidatus Pelagibacter bacterium]|jgi:2-polyprenyl-3-methyl-5-hydroxy-6-metoxy-1,4-benzoquinol methylase|nr:class I SAM-dependent methyltransferase [Candidatus Pelagibacter bacterium]